MVTTNDRIDQLRDLLYGTPDAERWGILCQHFEDWPASSVSVGLDYALRHLDANWPDELRPPPPHWRQAHLDGRTPAAWPLVRAFDVVLHDHRQHKIGSIKVVRQFSGLGLKDAKDLVEAAPTRVLLGAGLSDALNMLQEFINLGVDPPQAALYHHEGDRVASPPHPSDLAHPALVASSWQPQIAGSEEMEVVLVQCGNLIQAIKVVRELTGLGLKESKDLVDRRPSVVLIAPRIRAEEVRRRLEEVGAQVELRPLGAAPASPGGAPPSHTASAPIGDYGVELVNTGRNKIEVIRIIRDGDAVFRPAPLSLSDAKRLADDCPSLIADRLPHARATALVAALEAVGAMADIVRSGG